MVTNDLPVQVCADLLEKANLTNICDDVNSPDFDPEKIVSAAQIAIYVGALYYWNPLAFFKLKTNETSEVCS